MKAELKAIPTPDGRTLYDWCAGYLRAGKELGGPFLFLYGDILFERGHLEKMLKSPADISLLVDRAWGESYAQLKNGGDQKAPWEGRGAPDELVTVPCATGAATPSDRCIRTLSTQRPTSSAKSVMTTPRRSFIDGVS